MKNYYDKGGISVQDILRAKLTREEYIGWCKGNILKYTMRAKYKDDEAQDLKKAADYMKWLNECMNGSNDNDKADADNAKADVKHHKRKENTRCLTCPYRFIPRNKYPCDACESNDANIEVSCSTCLYEYCREFDYPCSECDPHTCNKYEPKKAGV